MRKLLFSLLVILTNESYSQLEFSTGYAINKRLADGLPISVAYDFKIKNKLYTKSQLGFKFLLHYNDYVGSNIKVSIFEFHQTFSYELVNKKNFIFKPNIGFNYRFYKWNGNIEGPFNTLPQRVYIIGFRNYKIKLNSFSPINANDGNFKDIYKVQNLGFSIQLQTQFRINEKIWIHVTPFIEPDYDRIQNTGGVYLGIILKDL